MWKYLFSSIPEIVFEAFAVCTLIWAVFSIFLLRKRNKVLFWLFAGTVFCMILWRISLHSIMASSRYAAILIYPAAVFSGCLSMKSKLIFRWIFRKLKLNFLCLHLICRLLPVVVFTGLMIACTAKSLRVNSQGDFIRKICRKYLRVSGGKGHVYVTANEVYRISWHIKRRNKDICRLPIRKESGFSEVCKQVTLLKNMPGDHYFFFYVRKGETEPNAASMNFDKTSGTWEVLARYYTSKRKNKEIILARYRSVCPNIQEWNGKIPEEVKGNLYKAGDFETVLQGRPLKQLEKYYKENNVVTYTDLSRKKLPANWQLGIGKWNRNNPPDIRLLETAPLAGKYSLLLDSRTPGSSIALCAMRSYIYGKVCEYTLFARGEGQKETHLSIMAVSVNQKEKKAKTTVIGRFLLSPGKVYRMRGIIPVNRYPEGFRNFCIRIYVKGSASLDQFTLIPVK